MDANDLFERWGDYCEFPRRSLAKKRSPCPFKQRKAKGLCMRCGLTPARSGQVRCDRCATLAAASQRGFGMRHVA